MALLTETELDQALTELNDWTKTNNTIKRELKFDDFKTAFSFMTRVAFEAEAEAHHPNWENVYNQVKIALQTHDAGGITQKDIDLAQKIDAIATSLV